MSKVGNKKPKNARWGFDDEEHNADWPKRTGDTMAELLTMPEYLLNEEKGYNPSQPRIPAGDPRGGQWASQSGVRAGFTVQPASAPASSAGSGDSNEPTDSEKIELSHAEQLESESIKKKTGGDYFRHYQEIYEARRGRSQEYPEKYRKKLIALKSRSEKKIEKLQDERKAVCEELQKHERLWCQECTKHRDKLKNGRRFFEIPEAELEQINDAAVKHANSMMPADYKELDKRRSDLWEEMVAERASVRGRAHKLLEVPPSERSSLNVRHDPDSDSGFPKEVLSSGGYVKIENPEVLNNVKDGTEFVQKMIGNRHGDVIEIAALQLADTHSQRPHQAVIGGKSAICIGKSTSPAVVAHEIGHAIDRNYRVLELTQGFLVSRAGGESPLPMRKLFPNHGYENGEYGRKDDWLKTFDGDKSKAYYTGKHYRDATEILSMGLELLYDDPVGFAKRDPEYFNLVVGIMHGDYL